MEGKVSRICLSNNQLPFLDHCGNNLLCALQHCTSLPWRPDIEVAQMTSGLEPDSRDPEEKDETSNESLAGDEENALPSEKEKDVEYPSPPDEQKPAPPPSNDSGPPNGGKKAWLQVLGAWMLFFNTWGVLK